MKKVSVIGAGFAGLTLSLKLAQKGFAVDLYEKSSRVGGLLGTDVTEHGLAEHAANALLRTEKTEKLFYELGLEPLRPLPSAKKRFIFRYQPKKWPLTFFESVFFLGKFLPRFFIARNSLKPRAQETLEAWGQRFLGSTATEYLLGPAMQGIYGNEISGLSSQLILAPLFASKKEKYQGLISCPAGMQELIDQLEKKLLQLGVQIHKTTTVALKSLKGPVVVATPANVAATLLEETQPETSALLKNIRMSSLLSATLFFEKPQVRYQGFGCLIPRGFEIKSLGVLMNSFIFKGRNQTYNETWILGGVKEEALLKLTDAEILKLLSAERFKVLGSKEALLDYRIHRWPAGLPYYDLNLETFQKNMAALNSSGPIFLHGNYLSGIGLSKILEHSEILAEKIASFYV